MYHDVTHHIQLHPLHQMALLSKRWLMLQNVMCFSTMSVNKSKWFQDVLIVQPNSFDIADFWKILVCCKNNNVHHCTTAEIHLQNKHCTCLNCLTGSVKRTSLSQGCSLSFKENDGQFAHQSLLSQKRTYLLFCSPLPYVYVYFSVLFGCLSAPFQLYHLYPEISELSLAHSFIHSQVKKGETDNQETCRTAQ